MAKRIDKIIQSKTAPKNNNVLWDDGKNLKVNRNGNWKGINTLDWDAQEGEAGYIKNKPFRKIKSNNNEITNINSLFVITEEAFYPTIDLFIKYNNKIVLLAKEKQEIYWGDGVIVEMYNTLFYLRDDGESNIIVDSECEFDFELIIPLNSDFIPYTIKTTPQELSDEDKNQALVNLGISEKIDLCKALKSIPIIIDYDYSGTFTFEEYGISIEQSNILLLAYFGAFISSENQENAFNALIVEKNIPSYDQEFSWTQLDDRFIITYEYIRYEYDEEYEQDIEVSFGYTIDLKNRKIIINRG